MRKHRRDFIKLSGVYAAMAAAGLLSAEEAFAQQQARNKAFEAKSLDETVKALGGTTAVQSGTFRSPRRTSRKMAPSFRSV